MASFISRGKSFSMGVWDGPAYQQGISDGVRYQKTRFLNDGKKVVLVSDQGGNEKLEIHFIKISIFYRKSYYGSAEKPSA